MTHMRFFAWLFLFSAVTACISSHKESDSRTSEATPRLVVTARSALLREQAGQDSRVLQTLAKGDALFALPEVSSFTTPLKLQGKAYNEPWLSVRTAGGVKGWIYASDVQLDSPDEKAARRFLLECRLQSLAGPAFKTQLAQYRQKYAAIASADDFAAAFRLGRNHADSLVSVLSGMTTPTTDLFWLGELFPGYAPQLVAEGTAYYLFEDYRQWLQKAGQTPESDDDELTLLFISAFPDDSIAYFFPAWTIQTADYTGHSLLGRGKHLQLLQHAQQLLNRSRRFEPEILQLKTDLLNDITQAGVTYWESRDKIIAEVDNILTANLNLLTPADKIALQTRRSHLENPETYGIQVNQQAGF